MRLAAPGVTIIFGILALVGVFLPWLEVTITPLMKISATGWNLSTSPLLSQLAEELRYPLSAFAASIVMMLCSTLVIAAYFLPALRNTMLALAAIAAIAPLFGIFSALLYYARIPSHEVDGVSGTVGAGWILSCIAMIIGLISALFVFNNAYVYRRNASDRFIVAPPDEPGEE